MICIRRYCYCTLGVECSVLLRDLLTASRVQSQSANNQLTRNFHIGPAHHSAKFLAGSRFLYLATTVGRPIYLFIPAKLPGHVRPPVR